MTDESAASRVEQVKRLLRAHWRASGKAGFGEVEPIEEQILDIVRKQDERIASLEETIEILSNKDRLKVLEKGAESARKHGSHPYEARAK